VDKLKCVLEGEVRELWRARAGVVERRDGEYVIAPAWERTVALAFPR
jgi:hypothetical protein